MVTMNADKIDDNAGNMTKKSNDPYSPFTISLINIRDSMLNLGVQYRDQKKLIEKVITYFLNEIILLCFYNAENKYTVEFPIAGFVMYEKVTNKEVHKDYRYTGQFDMVNDSSEDNLLADTNERIENYLFNNTEWETIDTSNNLNLPENIRAQFFSFKVDEVEWGNYRFTSIIFIKSSEWSQDDKFAREVKNCFDEYIRYGIPAVCEIFYDRSDRVGSNDEDNNTGYQQYPILRDILTNIQKSIHILEKKNDNEYAGEESELDKLFDGIKGIRKEAKSLFKVVFVVPRVKKSEYKYIPCFNYVLTNEQRRWINNLKNKYEKELKTFFHSIKTGTNESFEKLKKRIDKYIDIDLEQQNDNKLDEELRQDIFIWYALCDETIEDFEEKALNNEPFSIFFENKDYAVTRNESFLLTKIFEAKRPDIVGSFIKHPFSKDKKYGQYPTPKLKDLYKNKKKFYPRYWHLLELMFFPDRYFMYPVFHYGAPLLLCAFDADYFRGSRQSLISLVDTHKEAIFSNILGYELTSGHRKYLDVLNEPSSADSATMNERLKEKSRNYLITLLNHFNVGLEIKEKMCVIAKHITNSAIGQDGVVEIPESKDIYKIENIKNIFKNNNEAFKIFYFYTRLYFEGLQRSLENIKLAKDAEWKSIFAKLYHNIQAHLKAAIRETTNLENKMSEIITENGYIAKPSTYLYDMRLLCDLSRFINEPNQYPLSRDGRTIIRHPEWVNVSEVIEKIIGVIKNDIKYNNFETIRVGQDMSDILMGYLKKNELFAIKMDNKASIYSFPEVITVIIKDILINATSRAVHVKSFKEGKLIPKVTIILRRANSNEVSLTVRNECGITKRWYNIWTMSGDITDLEIGVHNPLGVVISKKFLDWLQYKYRISKECIFENGGKFTEIEIMFTVRSPVIENLMRGNQYVQNANS